MKYWTHKIVFMSGSNSKEVLRITVNFEKQFFAIFLVTYLPTILMNILNQATNYFSGDSKHDLIITVNVTSMMVLASIYLSVSASLRKTHNIKPVEIWLLFNLAYPFLVILVNIVINVSVISTALIKSCQINSFYYRNSPVRVGMETQLKILWMNKSVKMVWQ